MPLLEEDPTLTIYENDPVLFYTKDKTKIKDDKKDFEINPNFRLIMTTSKEANISLAIKSRCLCIQIKPFNPIIEETFLCRIKNIYFFVKTFNHPITLNIY